MTDEERWSAIAELWHEQVGDEGDRNRIANSDPWLWRFLGPVDGLSVLDAGCGTGYLSRKLAAAGARVIAVDYSRGMVDLARRRAPELDVRQGSVSALPEIAAESVDRYVSNYVWMDAADPSGAAREMARVLVSGGIAVVVISHPCFPGDLASDHPDGPQKVIYTWEYNYFESQRVVAPPWGRFTTEFVHYHRPLSAYFRAFRDAGMTVDDFAEPRADPDRFPPETTERHRVIYQVRPYSAVFRLLKP